MNAMNSMKLETQFGQLARPKDAACNASPQPRRRILLADDSPQIRDSLSKLLRNAGYHVSLAANGVQALNRALQEDFDLLLLDLNMPGIDGWGTLENLATLRPRLPVFVITAEPNQHDWALLEGAKGLMEKPLNPALLLQSIEELLSQSTEGGNGPGPEKFEFRRSEKPFTPFFGNRQRWESIIKSHRWIFNGRVCSLTGHRLNLHHAEA